MFIKRGDIFMLDETGQGSVQAGLRPVIVVQNNIGNHFSPTTIVCSITSANKPKLPTHLYIGKDGGLYKNSTILCEQIKTVNKDDLIDKLGSISDKITLQELNKRILISLGLLEGDQYAECINSFR